MTPRMKPSFYILCLAIAMHCWAEDNILHSSAISDTRKPDLQVLISSNSEDAALHVNLGLQHCLLNYQEKARYHFKKAVEADDQCLLAHVGMLMVYPSGSIEYKQHLAHVNALSETAVLTPVEEWYFATFLQYISGDIYGTAAAFRQRAATYRRDTSAACWDILLNHYAAEQGADIIARANALVSRYPEHALVHYCRALLDEYSSDPSQEALTSARKSVELLPGNPTAHQLLGHLLRRSGKLENAINEFHKARQCAASDLCLIPESDAACYRLAVLSEISANWSGGRKIDALRQCHALSKQISTDGAGEGSILMQWEARTLPLRLLVLQPTAPAGAAINAAAQACNAPSGTPIKHVEDCLIAAIRTRSLADSGRYNTATQTLSKAEEQLAELRKYHDEMTRKGGLLLTCYRRAVQACTGAIIRARLALYTDSADIWQPHLNELLAQPEPRLMPPVLPAIK